MAYRCGVFRRPARSGSSSKQSKIVLTALEIRAIRCIRVSRGFLRAGGALSSLLSTLEGDTVEDDGLPVAIVLAGSSLSTPHAPLALVSTAPAARFNIPLLGRPSSATRSVLIVLYTSDVVEVAARRAPQCMMQTEERAVYTSQLNQMHVQTLLTFTRHERQPLCEQLRNNALYCATKPANFILPLILQYSSTAKWTTNPNLLHLLAFKPSFITTSAMMV